MNFQFGISMNLILLLFAFGQPHGIDSSAILKSKCFNCGLNINKALKVQMGKILHDYQKSSERGALGIQKSNNLKMELRRAFKIMLWQKLTSSEMTHHLIIYCYPSMMIGYEMIGYHLPDDIQSASI